MSVLTKSSCSVARRRLIELMQRVNFGRIEGLQVRDGDPVLQPPPKVIREVKFAAAENGPRPEAGSRDFALKTQVVELMTLFDDLRDGTVDVLEVKHGLPFRVFVASSGD